MTRRTTVLVIALAAVLALLGGLAAGAVALRTGVAGGDGGDGGDRTRAGAAPTPSSTTRAPETRRAAPWPQRPDVRLSYDVHPDHRGADGDERVRFTPDRKVCGSLVFRAWPNKPQIAGKGGSLTVRKAWVRGDRVRPRLERKGAPTGVPGTLIRLPLKHCVAADATVTARLTFTVRTARDSAERVGDNRHGEMWLAAAYPTLAWERGHGWMTEPAVDVFGETEGSEEFRLRLSVVAPAADTVLGTGRDEGTSKGPRPDTTRHRFTADSVRNVAISAGGYRVTTRTIAGVKVRVGVSDDGVATPAAVWLDTIAREIPRLERYFGTFPYRDLWVTVIPDTTGIEFPGAIFYGDYPPKGVTDSALVGHELAHEWFYSLVGDDQARDPWLDEAFAQYAQGLADGQASAYEKSVDVPAFARNKVGAPMTYWAHRPGLYGVGVYQQGATMLFEARKRAGPDRWDAAVRAYIAKNAHRIARPEDFLAAVRDLPGAARILREHGAVP